jgi:predicted RNA-binding Zn ribbon-like protein
LVTVNLDFIGYMVLLFFMVESISQHPRFDLVGGDKCLDFTNTLGGLRGGVTREYLHDYTSLLAWTLQAGLLDEKAIAALQRAAAQKPAIAARALARAIEGREAIYAIFSAVAAGRPAPAGALAVVNETLAAALGQTRLAAGDGGFFWDIDDNGTNLERPLWSVMRQAAELLISDRRKQVRECSGDECSWLFLDISKNHSRLWCSMSGCGNRTKVRRHRARQG